MKIIFIITTLLISGCADHVVPPEFWQDVENTTHEPERLPEWTDNETCGEILLDVQNKYQRCALQSDAVRDKITALEDTF